MGDMKQLKPLSYAAASCLLLMTVAGASVTVNVTHLCDSRATATKDPSSNTESSSRPSNADGPSASFTEFITVRKPWMSFMYASRTNVQRSSSQNFSRSPSKSFLPFVLQPSPRPTLQSFLNISTKLSSEPAVELYSQSTSKPSLRSTLQSSLPSTLQFLSSQPTSTLSWKSTLMPSSQSTPHYTTLQRNLYPSPKSPLRSTTHHPSSRLASESFSQSTFSQISTQFVQISSLLPSLQSSSPPSSRNSSDLVIKGPIALKQVRFPSAKYDENVKLDQQTSRPDFSITSMGPFGFGLVVSDAGLRFIGIAEAAVMWHSMPAELVIDLISNPYEWDAIAKKILPYEWPLIVVCGLMIVCGLVLARYGVYWQRRYKEAKWLGDTGWESGCKKGVLVVAVQMLLLMLGAGACGLLVTNETMGSAVTSVGDLLEFGVGDLVDMFSVTQKQIRTITVGSMDSTTDAIFSKLDDIAEQLGGPIENDIYGPSHIFGGSRSNVTRLVQDFQKIFPKAKDVLSQAESVKDDIIMYNKKIIELNTELQMVPERCPLEVSEMCKIISDNKLKAENYTYLDDLINSIKGVLEVENDGLSSLPLTSAENANIPKALYEQTEKERWRIKQTLMDRRRQLEFSIYPYESHTRKIVSKLMDMKESANNYIVHLKRIETYRWSVSVGIAIGALLVWILLACSIVVNYCSQTTWAKCYFFGCVSAMRLTSIALWLAALVGLMVSSNGEANVCRPLYDEPAYETVTKIMDCPTVTSERGFFSSFVLGNETSIAPFNEIIESCKGNHSAYSTFNLNKVFDVETSSDYSKWPGVMDALDGLKTRRVHVELDVNSRAPSRADALKPISESTNLDFQKFRSLILTSSLEHGRVTLLRDQLNTLLTQTTTFSNTFKYTLKHVVANISDLIESVMSPMGQRKNMLLYHLTLMEVEMEPLSESLNQTWANAYTRIENSDFDQILRKNMAQYMNSIKSLLEKYKSHVTEAVKTEATSCRPVWNIYRIGRDLVCRQALDSLNGFWVICFFIAMSITVAIPVVKNLKIFHKSPLTSMSLYTIPPPPAMELMCTNN